MDMEEIVGMLASLPSLRNSSSETLRKLATAATPREFHSGELLFSYGESPPRLFLLTDGRVRLSRPRDNDDDSFIIERAAPCLLGEAAALDNGPHMVTAKALSAVSAQEIPVTVWTSALKEDATACFAQTLNLVALLRSEVQAQG